MPFGFPVTPSVGGSAVSKVAYWRHSLALNATSLSFGRRGINLWSNFGNMLVRCLRCVLRLFHLTLPVQQMMRGVEKASKDRSLPWLYPNAGELDLIPNTESVAGVVVLQGVFEDVNGDVADSVVKHGAPAHPRS